MISGLIYRNSNPACTFDILIQKVQFKNEKIIKIKFWFVSRNNKQIVDLVAEKATLKVENLKDWSEVKWNIEL